MNRKKSIAALGPSGTFSELAARTYIKATRVDLSIKLFQTIKKLFTGIEAEGEYGIVPIENMAEGFVQTTMDCLIYSNLRIIHEILLPVQFSFVSKATSLNKIRKVYVQFVTQGQCQDFLDSLEGVEIITTPSNGTSLKLTLEGTEEEGGIVPIRKAEESGLHITQIHKITIRMLSNVKCVNPYDLP